MKSVARRLVSAARCSRPPSPRCRAAGAARAGAPPAARRAARRAPTRAWLCRRPAPSSPLAGDPSRLSRALARAVTADKQFKLIKRQVSREIGNKNIDNHFILQ